MVLVVKNLPASAGDVKDAGSIPGWGRSPGGGHGKPLQYLAWRTSWTDGPGRLQSIGSQSIRRNGSGLEWSMCGFMLISYAFYFYDVNSHFFFYISNFIYLIFLFFFLINLT